jgi:hypothetical protein
MTVLAHALTAMSATKTPDMSFIPTQLWHGYPAIGRILGIVFGPLNAVRTALVIAAAIAALVSLIAGYPAAAAVLAIGVEIHGLGWLYLYVTRDRANAD